MRLYPFVFLAFAAAPARATGSARVSNSSLTKGDFAASDPLFVDGTKDAPADQQARAQESTNDEERIPTPGMANLVPWSYFNDAKAVLSKLYSDAPAHLQMLPPTSWSQVVTNDEKALERVDAYIKAVRMDEQEWLRFTEIYGPDIAQIDPKNLALVLEDVDVLEMLETLETWMSGQKQEDLVEVLAKNGFFEHFRCAHVEALKMFLVRLNTKKDTIYNLFDILSEGFGGEGKVASFLSLAKLSPFTKKVATSLQLELLKTWKSGEKKFNDVVTLLGLDALGKEKFSLTYEHLDTLAEYWYLVEKERDPHTAPVIMVMFLRNKFHDAGIVPAMMDGLEHVQSGRAYLHERYGDKSIKLDDMSTTLETKQHDGFLRQFESVLFEMWYLEGKTPETLDGNPFKLSESQAEQLRAEYGAAYKSEIENPTLGVVSG